MMNPLENKLWHNIENFQLDQPNATLSFSKRLARDNGWTHDFALQVIAEYKRFIFLCCISEREITPSDIVDQAWHLHMIYTKSYWEDFCQKTLGKAVHHNPTQGGGKERNRFGNAYDYTFKLYKEKFGTDPPVAIWQDSDTRFKDIDFVRVNRRNHWIIPKPHLRFAKGIGIMSLALVFLLFIQANGCDLFGILSSGVLFIIAIISGYKAYMNPDNNSKKNQNSSSGGCSTSISSGCGSDSGGDSGCGSGCSGCGGCGGCGG